MSRYLGYDSPDLFTPAVALQEYVVALDAYNKAENAYNRYAGSLSKDDLTDPSDAIVRRVARLERRFDRLIGPKRDAEATAIEALESLGVGVNRGGVNFNGRLFAIVRDMEARQPNIVIIDLADVVDLDI